LSALTLYGLMFDSFSETQLVRLSFVWLPLVAFGLAVKVRDSIPVALTWTVAATVALGVFIYGIFPAL
jgi:hypothetical protein